MSEQHLVASIDAHFAGRLRAEAERPMREHLPRCAACRAYYERHLLLAALDPAAPPTVERLGSSFGFATRVDARTRASRVVGVALAASLAALVVARLPSPVGDGFVARGPAGAADFAIYRVGAGGGSTEVRDEIAADDELAFGYDNPAGHRYLMIFSVDPQSRVFWYYPAWTDPTADPSAISIAAGAAGRELPEAVRHPFSAGPLEIHALFLDEPLQVQEVERRIAASGAGPETWAPPGALVRTRRLTVRDER